jgi:serine/threonine protein kinase
MENVVYDEKNDLLKIIDFGTSVSFQSLKTLTDADMVNTFHYRPPECLISSSYQYNQTVDIWAIGCIMYYFVTKHFIIERYVTVFAVDDIFKLLGTPTKESWPEFSTIKKDVTYDDYPGQIAMLRGVLYPYSDLILDCLTVNPNKRPLTNELLNYF